ncbi:MAG: hypothetical protein JXR63_07285 [Spirochaetales bacterium]|nr:hypothetical protein [Spirochaetales bacterium]
MKRFIYLFLIIIVGCNGLFEKKPGVPSGLTVSGSDSDPLTGQISLEWRPVKDAGIFFIYRGEGSQPSQTSEFLIAQTSSLSYVDTEFEPDDENIYYYSLSAGSTHGKYESSLTESKQGWLRKSLWEVDLVDELTDIRRFEIVSDGGTGGYLVYLDVNYNFYLIYFFLNQDEDDNLILDYQKFDQSLGKFDSSSDLSGFSVVANGTVIYLVYADSDEGGDLSTTRVNFSAEEDDEGEQNLEIEVNSFGNSGFSDYPSSFSVESAFHDGFLYCSLVGDDGASGYGLEAYRIDTSGFLWESLPGGGPTVVVDADSESFIAVDGSGTVAGASINTDKIALYRLNSFNTDWNIFKEAIPTTKSIVSGIVKKNLAGLLYALYSDGTSLDMEYFSSSGDWENLSLSQQALSSSLLYDFSFSAGIDLVYSDNGIYYKRYSNESWNLVGRNSSDPTKKGLVSSTVAATQIKTASNHLFWLEAGKIYFAILN